MNANMKERHAWLHDAYMSEIQRMIPLIEKRWNKLNVHRFPITEESVMYMALRRGLDSLEETYRNEKKEGTKEPI